MGTWLNDDGLFVKFGTDEAAVTRGGEDATNGDTHVVHIDFDYSDLAATGTEKIMADNVTIPNGAFIKAATLRVSTAFAGATATLSIGLIDQDRSTAIDADGIDATIAVTAIDAVGDEVNCDGALVGTTLTNTGLITMTEGTAAFTAGVAKLTVEYYMP